MSQPALARMTPEEFFAWGATQEDKYELVNGTPLLLHWNPETGMSGASRRHDQIVMNLIGELRARMRGRSSRPFTSDTAVRTTSRQFRRPDAGIECGPRQDDGSEANDPRVVFEVLSPSTRTFDLLEKLDEYKALPSLAHIVIVEPDSAEAKVWSQSGGFWTKTDVAGLDAAITLAAVDVEIPISEIYDGLTFKPRPRVVEG